MSDFLDLQGAKDLNTDAIHISAVANSIDPVTGAPIDAHVNRVGGVDYTLQGFWDALGPVVMPWTSATGGTLTQPNQAFLHPANGNYYSWTGAYPVGGYVVAPGTDPTAVTGYVPRTAVGLRSQLAADDGASLSLSMLATTYGVSYASGSIWTPGYTMNVGQWAYYGNKLWAPNADATVCGAVPDYTNFHTLNVNKILRPENFGAVKDADATAAINRLVVYQTTYGMGLVQLLDEFEYLVSPATHAGLPGTFGDNSVCINLVSNLNIQGGKLKLRNGTGGASGAILANRNGVAIDNVVVSVSIDGNKANTTGTMSGVVIANGTNCHWDGTGRTVKNLSFNGVQFALSNLGCSAKGGTYKNITYIGLQAQRADGFQALHGHFYSIGDNAIDLEANNGNMDQNIIGYNVVNGCNCGVFLESGGNSIVIGNSIEVFKDIGVICNQINTPSNRNLITANKIKRGDGVGTIGIRFVNNSGYSSVYGNYFEGLDYSIRATIATRLHVGVNTHMDIKKQLVYIDATTNSLTYSLVERQVLLSARNSSTGYPFSTAPLGNSNNHSDRDYTVTVEPMFRTMTNSAASSSDDEYIKSTYNTVYNTGWASYAVYTGGRTLVNMPGVATGNYVLINGTLYLLYDFVGGGWQIRDLAGLDGNFTATVNGNYPVTEYYKAWQTD